MAKQSGSPYSCVTRQDAKRQNQACNQQADAELSRLSTHAFINKGVIPKSLVADARAGKPGASKALADALVAAEQGCKGFIIRESSGSYDGGSPVTGKATGRATETIVSTKHVITGNDPKYVGNEGFWAAMRANAKDYDYFGGTSSRAWAVQDKRLEIAIKPAISDTPTDEIGGEFTVTYNDLTPLTSAPVDMDALNDAPFLPYVALTAQASNAGTLTSSATAERIAVASGATLAYKTEFTGGVDYSIRAESGSLLPAGINMTVDTGILTWTPTAQQAGTWTVYVRAENACGVLGEVEVEITVA